MDDLMSVSSLSIIVIFIIIWCTIFAIKDSHKNTEERVEQPIEKTYEVTYDIKGKFVTVTVDGYLHDGKTHVQQISYEAKDSLEVVNFVSIKEL